MFDLEKAIAEWREQMLAAGIKSPVPFEELESHLRDDVEQQIRSGSSSEKAFAIAVNRIGEAHALKTEFDHAGFARQNLQRGKLLISFALVLAGLVIWLSAFTFSESGLTAGQEALALTAVVLTLLAAALWRYALRFVPVIRRKSLRLTTGFGVMLLGVCLVSLFNSFFMPHIEWVSHQLALIALFWGFLPGAALACLGIGIMMSEKERQLSGIGIPKAN